MRKMMRKIRIQTIVYAILSLIMFMIVTSLVLVYGFAGSDRITETLRRTIPYPLVVIGYRQCVTTSALSANMTSIRRFYEQQDFSKVGLRVDFSTDEGKKRFKIREKEVINKILEDDAIRLLAQKRGIFVTNEEAHQIVARKLEERGNVAEVTQDLDRLYGWTLDDFAQQVVIPEILQEKLQASFLKEVDTVSAGKSKIDLAQEALHSGQDFGDVAKQYSEGSTAQKGGTLGWFAPNDLVPALRHVVASQKIGVPGDVIESELGFHIVRVDEVKQEGNTSFYRISQIMTHRVTFTDWLAEQMREMPVFVLSPEYGWDRESARVEFRQPAWRDFEKKMLEQTEGDASLLF
ncbi:MAG: peptidylprolyl isomerase [Minisyncoccota bacterium]